MPSKGSQSDGEAMAREMNSSYNGLDYSRSENRAEMGGLLPGPIEKASQGAYPQMNWQSEGLEGGGGTAPSQGHRACTERE